MRSLLLVGLFLLTGCGVSEGDIYENLLTGDRIEIQSTGRCDALLRAHEGALEAVSGDADGYTMDAYRTIGITMWMAGEDSTASCVTYREPFRFAGEIVPSVRFVPSAELGESRWKKVN